MKMLMTSVVALALASVHAASDTVAFYPFCDGPAGASAIGTVTNAVDAGSYEATVIAKGSSPSVVFDADAPGRYLYESSQASSTLLVSNLQSLNIGDGDAAVSSATLTFPGVAEELSRHHDTGLTVEYFFRLSPENNVPNYSCTFELNCGLTYEGVSYPLLVYLPCSNASTIRYGLNTYDSSKAIAGYCSKIELGASIDRRLTYPLNDDRWHHFAIVEKNTGSGHQFLFYLDRILLKTHTLPATVSCLEAPSDAACKLVRGSVAGKFAGVRFSSRALGPTEFLVASERAPGAYGDDVLGFYPFDDRPDGAAAGGRTVFNAAQPMVSPCTVRTNSANSVATFSSEGPAKYIFVGEQYGATPYYTDPGSVYLSSSQTGDSGTLDFDRLATELSKCHATGQTVEWFFRLTDADLPSTSASFYCQAGYLYGTASKPNCLCLPFGMSYNEGRQFRFSLGYYSDGRCLTKDLPDPATDGLWHHIAVVEREDKLEIYVDYVLYGSVSVDGTQEETADRSLELVRGALHGKFSCVKVTKRPLAAAEFLRASNCETYWPKTLTHVTFDGTPNTDVPGTMENAATSFAATNANVYSAQDCSGDFTSNGKVTGNPNFSSNLKYRETLVTGEGETRADLSSVFMAATSTGEAGFRGGPVFRSAVSAAHALPKDFTMEGFFRFDKDGWAKDVGTYATTRDRLTLFGRKLSSGYSWKLSFVSALNQTSHKLDCAAYDVDGQVHQLQTASLPFKDNTWHHLAVTHESSANRLVVYCDYQPVLTNDLPVALNCPANGYLAIGEGTSMNDNNFQGWVDEFRYSNVCLKPEEFLKLEKVRKGLLLLFR